MKFEQHLPRYVVGDPYSFEFANQIELLNNEHLVQRSKDNAFYRFSLSPHSDGRITLMIEENEGTSWWVLGFITGTRAELNKLTLPKWVPNKGNYLKLMIKGNGETKTVEFKTKQELMNLAEMKTCPHLPDFYRFSISQNHEIIVEHDKGKFSWVLGVISGKKEIIDSLNLPKK